MVVFRYDTRFSNVESIALLRDEEYPLPAFQRMERKERLGELSPERRLVPAEPVDDLVIEIGQAQEADRDVPRCIRCVGAVDLRVKLLLTVWAADNILANFGAGSGESPGSPVHG